MKRIVRRVQTLNERAAELTSAAGQLPNRVAELREAMTATTGQLQTLKSDIQVNVADLKVDREDALSEAIAEIAGHAPVLAEAGFLLDGLDVEVSPIQRLIVQLVRYKDVETLELQPLIQQYQHRPTLRAILSAILKARAMAATIEIDGLDYHKLEIGIGPVPSVRICWRAEQAAPTASSWEPSHTQPLAAATSFFGPPVGSTPAAATEDEDHEFTLSHDASHAYDMDDGYGESIATTTATTANTTPMPEQPPEFIAHDAAAHETYEPASPEPAPVEPIAPPEPVDPLARFKVMPALGRQP